MITKISCGGDSNAVLIDLQSFDLQSNVKALGLNVLELRELNAIVDKLRSKQWLGVRVAAQKALLTTNNSYFGIKKNNNQKPFLIDSEYFVSLAHCEFFALAAVNKYPIGVDCEKNTERFLDIKNKFLSSEELNYKDLNSLKLTVLWCAKEAVYKLCARQKALALQKILIHDFDAIGFSEGEVLASEVDGYNIKIFVKQIFTDFIIAQAQYNRNG